MYPLTSIVNVVPPCVVLHGRKVEGAKPTVSQMIDVYSRGTDISPGLAVCQLRRFTLNDPTLYITQHSLMEARTDMQFKLKNSIRLTMLFNVPSGPDLLSAGPCSEKNVAALQLGRQTLFSLEKNWRPLFSHQRPCRVSAISVLLKNWRPFLLITIVSLGSRSFFRQAKICRSFCGGPFLWGPLFGRTC